MSLSNVDMDTVTLCRLMQPGDANIAGNVHGGSILKMIEEAGLIVSTRHCNRGSDKNIGPVGALARVEKTDFLLPMFVGEIAHLSAAVTYTSQHSLEVKVVVQAENLFSGVKRITNQATLWYVPVETTDNKTYRVCKVVPMVYESAEAEAAGKLRYEKQKKEREAAKQSKHLTDKWVETILVPTVRNADPHTPASAESALIHLVGVQDCGPDGKALGGVTMKLMDEVAGICAARYCHTNVLTASMDAVDFHKRIAKGNLLHFRSRPIFTSAKSILIQVVVMVEEVRPSPSELNSDEDRARFEEGRARYEANKLNRKKST